MINLRSIPNDKLLPNARQKAPFQELGSEELSSSIHPSMDKTMTSTIKLPYEPPQAMPLALHSLSILADLSLHDLDFGGYEPEDDF